MDFCKNLLDDSRCYIENYYAGANCAHTGHRIYNPKTHLVFKTEEDYRKMRSPENHYYYIEVEPTDILDEYRIMLSCDRMDDSEDESVECCNSAYPIIMLRDKNTDNIIGILKPADGDTFALNNEHELLYRKYVPMLSNA